MAHYEWRESKAGRRYVRVAGPKPAPVAEPEPKQVGEHVDYSMMSKAELVSAAEEAGLETVGTKATLIERLNDV